MWRKALLRTLGGSAISAFYFSNSHFHSFSSCETPTFSQHQPAERRDVVESSHIQKFSKRSKNLKVYDESIRNALPYLVSFQQQWGAPGLVVCVKVRGETVWNQAFGYSDVENAVPLSTHSKLRVASISKAFTSALLGILYENGTLDVDASIQKYIPDFPAQLHPTPITPRLLAAHLAGIRHYENKEFYSTTKYQNVGEAVQEIMKHGTVAVPGTKFLYSTYGYTLLSGVLEKAGGGDYLTLMKERVFGPLGMVHTCHDDHDVIIPHRSRFYEYKSPLNNSPYH